jgi:hypothetical protein
MNKLHRLKNNKKMKKNEETENLMIGNVPELLEAARKEIMVGEVATTITEFFVAMSFAIHVPMQLVLKVLICAQ